MNEKLIQYIWRFQYYDHAQLQTTTGGVIQVVHPGILNHDQGPDFSNARIRIGDQLWAGHVEMHLRTSDWTKHGHGSDPHYKNVILHVVWEHDQPVNDIPVLELSGRVPFILLERYKQLLQVGQFIPCERSISRVSEEVWLKWKERLMVERMEHKSKPILLKLEENHFHWEETCWWMLAGNFGGKVNGSAFQALAQATPLSLLNRHQNQPYQIEALLLGQAGLLEQHFHETYPRLLQKEFRFLRKKYGLKSIHEPIKFSRMRPGNFPTIRLAQLAILISRYQHFFARFQTADQIEEIREWLSVTAGNYWHDHYRFEDTTVPCAKNLGQSMIENILINTVCPLLYTFGKCKNEFRFQEKALDWLSALPAEQHRICRGFGLLGIQGANAFDAQALTELHNHYCTQLRCLDCMIGHYLLKENQDQAPQSTRILISG
ncbi:MAG: DUF2851 family protein [Chitinophagales bacterium]|nr:DUF2851 family protein [Chitinophagales bacterium]